MDRVIAENHNHKCKTRYEYEIRKEQLKRTANSVRYFAKLAKDNIEAKKHNPTTLDYILFTSPTDFLSSKKKNKWTNII